MENATKALIIAGAIIIAIVLISLGVWVLDMGSSSVTDAGSKIDQNMVKSFNQDIERYVGNNVRGSTIRSLWSTLNTINHQAATGDGREVTIKGITSLNDINNSRVYSVSVNYGTDGYIDEVTITGPGTQSQSQQ
jgi:hypothetical protein